MEPYVHDADKFHRYAVGFGEDPTDISEVTICYSGYESQAADIVKLAMTTCAKFGKTARFESQDYLSCPLVTPVSANYICEISPLSTIGGVGSSFPY